MKKTDEWEIESAHRLRLRFLPMPRHGSGLSVVCDSVIGCKTAKPGVGNAGSKRTRRRPSPGFTDDQLAPAGIVIETSAFNACLIFAWVSSRWACE